MKKQSAKQAVKKYAAQTRNILRYEDKQKASYILIGAILLAFFIMILTEIDL